jgi:hypothetical protein
VKVKKKQYSKRGGEFSDDTALFGSSL